MSASTARFVCDAHPAVVDDGHRAVPAAVRAPAGRLDRPDEAPQRCPSARLHVAVERGEEVARRRARQERGGRGAAELDRECRRLRSSTQSTSAPLVLAGDDAFGDVGAHVRVEAEAAHRLVDARGEVARAGSPCASAPRTPPGRPTRRGSRPTARPTCRVHGRRGRACAARPPGPRGSRAGDRARTSRRGGRARAQGSGCEAGRPPSSRRYPWCSMPCTRGRPRSCARPGSCSPRSDRCRWWCSGTTDHGVRDRGPLPAHGLPVAPGHGRVRSRHLPLAPRPVRPLERLHARPVRRRRRGFDVTIDGDDVLVARATTAAIPVPHLRRRLEQGLEDGLTLVIAKSVLGLLEAGVQPAEIVRVGLDFGTRYRERRLGRRASPCSSRWPTSSLTSTTADRGARARARARVRGARHAAISRRGSALDPLDDGVDPERLGEWYRRFVETRSSDAAERSLATADRVGRRPGDVEAMMFAAVTDHVFIDGGHTIDFTNKAFEALGYVGADAAGAVLPTLVQQTAGASAFRGGRRVAPPARPRRARAARQRATAGRVARGRGRTRAVDGDQDVADLGWELLDDDPDAVVDALLERDGPRRDGGAARTRASRSPPRSASCGSTRRTTTATGTPCTTRSPPPNAPAPGAAPQPDARAAPRPRARRAARLPRPLPQRAGGAAAHVHVRIARRARRVLGHAGWRERGRRDRVRLPARTAVTRRR